MTREQGAYRDAAAMWRAASDRSKAAAKVTGAEPGALLRRFVFERFLARVFARPLSPWVLKGGTAVLVRVSDARATTDVDLLHQLSDIDAAVSALRVAVATDLGDHLRFVITRVDRELGGAAQPNVDGVRVHIDAYAGARNCQTFHADLVTGSLMTADPETATAETIAMLGFEGPSLRLYPVVDHVADKLCATQAPYGESGAPSSRFRDLVDLVVFACTQDLDGVALTKAIYGEWHHRELQGVPVFDPPASWAGLYTPLARKTPRCAGYEAFEDAVALVSAMLTPALEQVATGRRWVAATRSWEPVPAQ